MTTLRARNLYTALLRGASLELGRGLHVVLGDPSDGTGDLARALSGASSISRGEVRIDGEDPRSSAKLRRAVAALWAEEPPAPGASVGEWIAAAEAFVGQRPDAARWLALFGAEGWSARRHAALSGTERRQLALALALAHPAPRISVLYEPLAAAPVGAREAVAAEIRKRGAESLVVVLTSEPEQAHSLGGTSHVLRRGIVIGNGRGSWLEATGGAELSLSVSEPRRLAALLSERAETLAVSLDATTGRVVVRGAELEPLARAIASACRDAGIEISAIVPRWVSLRAVQAEVPRA